MRLRSSALGLALMGALWLCAGCASAPEPRQAIKPLPSTILILDFATPEDFEKYPHTIDGWWFGSHSRFQNSNAGILFADSATDAIRTEMDWVELYSRLHVRQYFAKKRSLLTREFPDLAEDQVDELMGQISPLDFARELGADKVLMGRIVRGKTFFQRTFKYWSSTLEIECTIVDVDSGRTLWRYTASKTGRMDSLKTVMDAVAAEMAEKMKEDYFFDPNSALYQNTQAPAAKPAT